MSNFSGLLCILLLGAAPAWAEDAASCPTAIRQVQPGSGLPQHVLETLALVESGRVHGGQVAPWPWTINVDGTGHFYDSKAEAVAAVKAFQAGGAQSIDVGCMQINLRMHPHAFASLDDAFEPAANTLYGARFLRSLYVGSRSWGTAMTSYHSDTPALAADYARKILAVWPQAASLGLSVAPLASSEAPVAPVAPVDPHDYTTAFARQVAADMAARRARDAGLTQGTAPVTTARTRSLLRVVAVDPRHGSAWPVGEP